MIVIGLISTDFGEHIPFCMRASIGPTIELARPCLAAASILIDTQDVKTNSPPYRILASAA